MGWHFQREGDVLTTYTAAGIAVQCWGSDNPWGDEYSGYGIAQISKKQAETPYGRPIQDSLGRLRGYGLCIGEYDYRPQDAAWSAEFMRRRIQMVLDECKDRFCKDRDKFIVAALAQNGPGFTIQDMRDLKAYVNNNEIKWEAWYGKRSNRSKKEYRTQWRLFYKFAKRLSEDGYYLPPNVLNDEVVLWLKAQ